MASRKISFGIKTEKSHSYQATCLYRCHPVTQNSTRATGPVIRKLSSPGHQSSHPPYIQLIHGKLHELKMLYEATNRAVLHVAASLITSHKIALNGWPWSLGGPLAQHAAQLSLHICVSINHIELSRSLNLERGLCGCYLRCTCIRPRNVFAGGKCRSRRHQHRPERGEKDHTLALTCMRSASLSHHRKMEIEHEFNEGGSATLVCSIEKRVRRVAFVKRAHSSA